VNALAFLAATAGRNLLLALLAGCGLAVLRRPRPHVRLHLWKAVLALCLAMPLLMAVLPGWSPTLRILPATARSMGAGPSAAGPHVPLVLAPAPGPREPRPDAAPMGASPHAAAPFTPPRPATLANLPPALPAAPPPPLETALPSRNAPGWADAGLAVYALVALALLIRLGTGMVLAGRLMGRARPIEDFFMGAGPSAPAPRAPLLLAPAWGPRSPMPGLRSRGPCLHCLRGAGRPAEFRNPSRRLCPQCKRRDPRVSKWPTGTARILESDEVRVPVTVGVMRPAILVPSDWPSWDAAQRAAVAAHEQSHISRRDAVYLRLAYLHRALFWFSPLGWWLPRHLGALAERASDEDALRTGIDAAGYAELLVGFVRRLGGGGRTRRYGVAMASARGAEKRVEQILQWSKEDTMPNAKTWISALTATLIPATILVAVAQPTLARRPPHPASPDLNGTSPTHAAAVHSAAHPVAARAAEVPPAGSGFEYALVVEPKTTLDTRGAEQVAPACSFTTYDAWAYVAVGNDCTLPSEAAEAPFSVEVTGDQAIFRDHGRLERRNGADAARVRDAFAAIDANNAKQVYLQRLLNAARAQIRAESGTMRAEAAQRSFQAQMLYRQADVLAAKSGSSAGPSSEQRQADLAFQARALRQRADQLSPGKDGVQAAIDAEVQTATADTRAHAADLSRQIDALGLEASGLVRQLERSLREMEAQRAAPRASR